jgi:GT2 family glycosyltransferase
LQPTTYNEGRHGQIAVQFVAASRRTKETINDSALGKSLARMRRDRRFTARLTVDNELGLPLIYNHAIESDDAVDVLAFIHDYVWSDDFNIVDHLASAIEQFDVIGVVGGAGPPIEGAPWFAAEDRRRGSIAQGAEPFGKVHRYSPSPATCALLDGVFIAARKVALIEAGVRFDPAFPFHFYDLDFCRAASSRGLKVGVWPIALTHQSSGNFHSPEWAEARAVYERKWTASVTAD